MLQHHTCQCLQGNVCFIDVDAQLLRLPEDMPVFPDRLEFIRELKDVIKCYGATLQIDYLRHRVQHKDRAFQRKHSLTDLIDGDSLKPSNQNVPPVTKYPSRIKIQPLQQKSGNAKIPFATAQATVTDAPVEVPVKKMSKSKPVDPSTMYALSYLDDMKFNNAVREVFLNRFVQIFYSYEHFVLHMGRDVESWMNNRESVHTFDKVGIECHEFYVGVALTTQS